MTERESIEGKSWPIAGGPSGSGEAKILGPRNARPDDEMWYVQYPNGDKRLVREQILRRILEEREPS